MKTVQTIMDDAVRAEQEILALKAQRDELLAGLNCALQALTFVRYVVGKPQIYTGSEVMTQRHESAITEISALIAKHSNKGAATKPEPEYNPLFIDGVQHDPLCLKVYRSPLKECDCGAAAKHKGAEHG